MKRKNKKNRKNTLAKLSAALVSGLLVIGLTSCGTNAPDVDVQFPENSRTISENMTVNYNKETLEEQKKEIGNSAYLYSDAVETDYQIVEKLGFTALDETLAKNENTRYFKQGRRYLSIDRYGCFTYHAGLMKDLAEMRMDEDQCLEIAENYLFELGLLNENSRYQCDARKEVWATTVLSEEGGEVIDRMVARVVHFYIAVDGNEVYDEKNQIWAEINAHGEVSELRYSVTDYEKKDKVSLCSIDSALQQIEQGNAHIRISENAEKLTFQEVSLVYMQYENEDGRYLIPVYLFKGSAVRSDGKISSFRILVQANR